MFLFPFLGLVSGSAAYLCKKNKIKKCDDKESEEQLPAGVSIRGAVGFCFFSLFNIPVI